MLTVEYSAFAAQRTESDRFRPEWRKAKAELIDDDISSVSQVASGGYGPIDYDFLKLVSTDPCLLLRRVMRVIPALSLSIISASAVLLHRCLYSSDQRACVQCCQRKLLRR